MQSRLFKFLLSPYLRRTARKLWVGNHHRDSFTYKELRAVLDSAWKVYHVRVRSLPKQANLGNWLVMHFGYLTLSAYQALKDFGLNEETSIRLIQDLTWYVTSTWAKRARRFSKILFRDKMRQLEFFVDKIMQTLFSPPGYKYEKGNLGNGFYLDVFRCPVAELMKTNSASELCVQSWCNVDFGLVEIFRGELMRSGTIAMGKEKCDFRFNMIRSP